MATSYGVSDSGTVRTSIPINNMLTVVAILLAGLLLSVVVVIVSTRFGLAEEVRASRAALENYKREMDVRYSLVLGDVTNLREAIITGERPEPLMSTLRATPLATKEPPP